MPEISLTEAQEFAAPAGIDSETIQYPRALQDDHGEIVATKALIDINAERGRQIVQERHSPEDDLQYTNGQLARAAACYALSSASVFGIYSRAEALWPWPPIWFKPKNPRRDLVRAGALILAEIERLDRKEANRDS